MSNIFVGVDGSSASKVAVRWAARDAWMRNAALTVVHVLPAPAETWPRTPPTVGLAQWQERQGNRIIADAIKIAQQSIDGRSHINSELLVGATVATLIDLSKEAEMIVVGCRGRGALQQRLLGSVSAGLVHHAYCPVAVIHDEDPSMPHPAKAPVLVGIDGSPASELATGIAFDQASRRGVELVALHAWSDAGVYEFPGTDWSTFKSLEDQLLAERVAGWQERYPDVTVRRVVVSDRPAWALVEQSESAQLVVVGSHGRGGFSGMLLGSVSSAVVQSARMPVIVARQR